MEPSFLLRGLAMGFAIAAPVGPIGLLCIQRTLAHGRIVGFVSGLGAASADAIYGAVAALGLVVVTEWLIDYQVWLRLLGGAFLIILGIRVFGTAPAGETPDSERHGLPGAYGSTFLLTLTNPLTIIAFAAVLVGMGLADQGLGRGGPALLVIGVFLGSSLWWFLLTGGVSLLRDRVTPRAMKWINRVAGALIITFGIGAAAAALIEAIP